MFERVSKINMDSEEYVLHFGSQEGLYLTSELDGKDYKFNYFDPISKVTTLIVLQAKAQ